MYYVSRLISVASNNKLYIGVCSYQTLIIIVLKRTNIFEILIKMLHVMIKRRFTKIRPYKENPPLTMLN